MAITLAGLVAVVLVSLFPLALHDLGGVAWSRLSDVGQAYGALAAGLTALTLVALTISILVQAHEARTAQEHGARVLHLEIVRMALQDPRLLGPYEWSEGLRTDEVRRQGYTNLWVMLWRTLYGLGDMTEAELRLALAQELFADSFGHRFWRRSREAYFASVKGRREERFYRIIDDEYRKSTALGRRADSRRERLTAGGWVPQHTLLLTAGAVTGILAGFKLGRLLSRRRTPPNGGDGAGFLHVAATKTGTTRKLPTME